MWRKHKLACKGNVNLTTNTKKLMYPPNFSSSYQQTVSIMQKNNQIEKQLNAEF